MMRSAYLAGPDVFLPEARDHAARKVAICTKYGLIGRPPLNEDLDDLSEMTNEEAWALIYEKDIAMMEACDIIIANLTPFGGASADAGTLIEVGWFLGQGKPVFGYSNSGISFSDRMVAHLKQAGAAEQGLMVESFGLPDNLMIVGAVHSGGCPIVLPQDDKVRGIEALDVFEACVAAAARHLSRD